MVRVTKLELHRSISEIMKKGDLDKLTTKKIRILCERKYKIDLTSRKDEIDKIVMAFVKKHSRNEVKGTENRSDSSDDGSSSYESCSGSETCSDSECSIESSDEESESKPAIQESPKKVPAKKNVPVQKPASVKKVNAQATVPAKKNVPVKKPASVKKVNARATKPAATAVPAKRRKVATPKQAEMDDAAYARQLQAEEFGFRARTVKKLFRDIPHKKGDKNEQGKKKRANPFMKKCLLSPALAEVLGTNEMSRPDIVQKMCSIVKERNLFDMSNKQYALCDEQLMKIFGKKRIRLIGMMKYLKHHIKDIH